MEENISEKSGFIRLAAGTALTAMGTSHLVKENGNRTLGFSLILCGAMKVAEGIFLYCPTKAMVNSNMKDAMSSTIGDFLDGEQLMSAFSGLYSNNSSSGGASNSNNSGGSSSSNSTMKNVASAASDIAKTVSNVAPSGSAVGAAAKAVESVTSNKKSN